MVAHSILCTAVAAGAIAAVVPGELGTAAAAFAGGASAIWWALRKVEDVARTAAARAVNAHEDHCCAYCLREITHSGPIPTRIEGG